MLAWSVGNGQSFVSLTDGAGLVKTFSLGLLADRVCNLVRLAPTHDGEAVMNGARGFVVGRGMGGGVGYGAEDGEDDGAGMVVAGGRRQGGAGLLNDLGRGAGVGTLGEFLGWEQLGIAVIAVARAEEVDEAFLGDEDGLGRSRVRWRSDAGGCGRCSLSGFLRQAQDWLFGFALRASLRMTVFVGRCGGRFGWEGAEHGVEGVDHLAGAGGVDGVLGEAVEDGGESGEDGGAVLDDGDLHAGDFGVDEEAALVAPGVLEVVVKAVILAFEGGRAAAVAGGRVDVMALEIGFNVWNGEWHGSPLGVCDFRMIFQTNHLPVLRVCK